MGDGRICATVNMTLKCFYVDTMHCSWIQLASTSLAFAHARYRSQSFLSIGSLQITSYNCITLPIKKAHEPDETLYLINTTGDCRKKGKDSPQNVLRALWVTHRSTGEYPNAPQIMKPTAPTRFQNPTIRSQAQQRKGVETLIRPRIGGVGTGEGYNALCHPISRRAGFHHFVWTSSIRRIAESMNPVPPSTLQDTSWLVDSEIGLVRGRTLWRPEEDIGDCDGWICREPFDHTWQSGTARDMSARECELREGDRRTVLRPRRSSLPIVARMLQRIRYRARGLFPYSSERNDWYQQRRLGG
jgi:hypothetical protein